MGGKPRPVSRMTDSVAVFENIQRAAKTFRQLPPVKIRNRFCNWPDYIENFHTAYGYTEATVRIRPTAKDIDNLDRVIAQLAWLTKEGGEVYSRIIWARAQPPRGVPWPHVARMAGLAPNTCKERFRVGIHAILYSANKIA